MSSCYYCRTKIPAADGCITGYKGNPRGSTRREAFCDVECMWDAGYGETCCSFNRVYDKETCDCAEPQRRVSDE